MLEQITRHPSVPSQRHLVSSDRSFLLRPHEYERLSEIHAALDRALQGLHRYVTGHDQYGYAGAAQRIRSRMVGPLPLLEYAGRMPTFVTTEFVLDVHRQPHLVSVNAHSARHWDAIVAVSRDASSALSASRLIQAIAGRFKGWDLVHIEEAPHARAPQLMRALMDQGVRIRSRTLDEAMRQSSKEWQCMFDLPLSAGRAQIREQIYRRSSFTIEPCVHLSHQSMLTLLCETERDVAVSDIVRNRIIDAETLAQLQSCVAKTYSIASTSLPTNAVMKSALPMSVQRCLSRSDVNEQMRNTELLEAYVAQERIEPLHVSIPSAHEPCPVRLICVSYRGELLTGMAVARIPSNGQPARDVPLELGTR